MTSPPFKMSYLKTIDIWYEDGGMVADELRGASMLESGTYSSDHPDVQSLIERLNDKIFESGSQARISDMTVDYSIGIEGRDTRTSVDYRVILEGNIADYVITRDSQRALVDLNWRGLTVEGPVTIDGAEINDPFVFLESNFPVTYDAISGTAAERIFTEYLINADFVLGQPLENWHFLFDPTGLNVDAGTFGLDESISGFVRSSWTMGERQPATGTSGGTHRRGGNYD